MMDSQRDVERLYRYHDGEMSWLARQWFGVRLRRSRALRAELAAIEQVAAAVERVAADPEPGAAPDLWPAIAAALPAVDAELTPARRSTARRPRRAGGGPGRRPAFGWAGLAAAAAVASVAVFVGLGLPGVSPQTPGMGGGAPALAPSEGVVRYLDSRGAPVLVIEDGESDMTIVWMMDPV